MVFETIAFADFANPAERAKRYRMGFPARPLAKPY
jgi:hypothetical protein